MSRITDTQLNKLFGSLRRIEHALSCINGSTGNDPQIEGVDTILYCDGNCNITGAIAFQRDETTGALITIYLDANYQITNVLPSGQPCDVACSPSQNQQELCLCDDVNGDGTVVNRFIRIVSIASDGTITIVGDYLPDYSGPYTVQGTVRDCSDIGNNVFLVQNRIELAGIQAWTRPDLAESVTIKVRRVGDFNNPPTITDAAGTVTPLYAGDVETWSVEGNAPAVSWLTGDFIVTLNHPDDIITIVWTQLQ